MRDREDRAPKNPLIHIIRDENDLVPNPDALSLFRGYIKTLVDDLVITETGLENLKASIVARNPSLINEEIFSEGSAESVKRIHTKGLQNLWEKMRDSERDRLIFLIEGKLKKLRSDAKARGEIEEITKLNPPEWEDLGYQGHELLFAFVAVDEPLLSRFFRTRPKDTNEFGAAAFKLRELRPQHFRRELTRQYVLDCIDALRFNELSPKIEKCEINNLQQGDRRRQELQELFSDNQNLSLVNVLLSQKESEYIKYFASSPWHRIALTKEKRQIPVIRSHDIEGSGEDVASRDVMYLSIVEPVSDSEREHLLEVFSLNHVPDVGI